MKTKALTTVIFFCIYSFAANAQVKKGSWMLGGQASFNSGSGKTDFGDNSSGQKSTAGSFEVSTGYTFKDNQVLGILLSYTMGKQSFTSNDLPSFDGKSNSKGIGAFYRLYHPLGNKFYVYGQAAASYSSNKMRTGIIHQTSNEARLAIIPGISYEVLKHVQLELSIPNILSLDYINTRKNADGQEAIPGKKSFSANTSLGSGGLSNLGIGFKIFI